MFFHQTLKELYFVPLKEFTVQAGKIRWNISNWVCGRFRWQSDRITVSQGRMHVEPLGGLGNYFLQTVALGKVLREVEDLGR